MKPLREQRDDRANYGKPASILSRSINSTVRGVGDKLRRATVTGNLKRRGQRFQGLHKAHQTGPSCSVCARRLVPEELKNDIRVVQLHNERVPCSKADAPRKAKTRGVNLRRTEE
jgi:hypothetical protein